MGNKFADLAARTMSAESRERAAIRTKALLEDMHLNGIRRARALSQEELAERLGTTQSEVSKIEHRTDVYLSTLRKYVRAMGGELEIIAHFAGNSVRINQFHEIDGDVDVADLRGDSTPAPSTAPLEHRRAAGSSSGRQRRAAVSSPAALDSSVTPIESKMGRQGDGGDVIVREDPDAREVTPSDYGMLEAIP